MDLMERFSGAALLGLILLGFLLLAEAAFGQAFPYGCGPDAARFAIFLENAFGEKPLWEGTEDDQNEKSPETHGARIVGYANPNTGSWTVVAIMPSMACVVKTGTGFKPAEKTLGPTL